MLPWPGSSAFQPGTREAAASLVEAIRKLEREIGQPLTLFGSGYRPGIIRARARSPHLQCNERYPDDHGGQGA